MSVKVLLELPTNDATTAFSALADCDKIKVIELGTKFLALGNNQLQYWSNDEWEMKIKSLKKNQQYHIDMLSIFHFLCPLISRLDIGNKLKSN